MILIGDRNMSLISDVRSEMKVLDTSKKSLRNFGLLIGAIFLALAILYYVRGKFPGVAYVCGPIGILLLAGGALFPGGLTPIYRAWMGLAFTLGWVVSRVLLTLLYYLVVTPTGILARICNKKFLDIDMKKKQDSYWIKKESMKVNYEKMY
jgi:hypothetical protein